LTGGPVRQEMTISCHAALDEWAFRALNADGGWLLDGLAVLLSSRAFGIAFGIALALIVALASRRHGRVRLIAALAAAVALSDGVGSQVLRPLFARIRPCYALPPGTFRWLAPAANAGSLPSLHAANFLAMATVAAGADPRLGAAAFVVAAGVALSRVYVGVHWPTDVLAGAAWGVVCGIAVRALAARIPPRVARPREGERARR
jgi:undecaprenyl-diphosphatase